MSGSSPCARARTRFARVAVLVIAVFVAGASPAVAGGGSSQLGVSVRSSSPEMVSGGQALVRVSLPSGAKARDVRVKVDGRDVTGALSALAGERALEGVVDGLRNGDSRITARAERSSASLRVTNYPITGPIFSGPHQTPYVCKTVESGMGEPLDEDCSAPTRYDYFYRSTSGAFLPLADPQRYPADVASTTVYGGQTVPFVVRVQSGTINRAIYRIAVLDDPAGASGGAWKPGPGWNGKLQYRFGGGCGFGRNQGIWFNQFADVLDPISLSRGFALATSTQNIYGTGCDDVLSAETAMMVKEHFSENYGVPRYTVGQGGSGGAMQQHLIAQNYPGILDAIVPERSFPDGQTLTHTPTDVALLNTYFAAAGASWADDDRVAVSGFRVLATLTSRWGPFATGGTNSVYPKNCFAVLGGPLIPPELVYDPVTNPDGVRCTVFDSLVTYLGRDPDTGLAERPLDNVGIQYGLKALNAGEISVEQFLDLNSNIGGHDIDGKFVPQRTEATRKAARAGFKSGRVFTGKGVELPILDLRHYRDDSNGLGDVHTSFHSFETRRRLLDARGTAANQIMWTTPFAPLSIHDDALGQGLDLMNQWLEDLLADKSNASYAKKVMRAKPKALKDGCWDPSGKRIDEPATFDSAGRCNTLYPYYGNARTAAGSPIQENFVKCRRKPVTRSHYRVSFSPTQWTRLRQTFRDGVCDYRVPGYGQTLTSRPWKSYGPARDVR